jgi:hypothetical protein
MGMWRWDGMWRWHGTVAWDVEMGRDGTVERARLHVGAARGEEVPARGEGARVDCALVAVESIEEAALHQIPHLPARGVMWW